MDFDCRCFRGERAAGDTCSRAERHAGRPSGGRPSGSGRRGRRRSPASTAAPAAPTPTPAPARAPAADGDAPPPPPSFPGVSDDSCVPGCRTGFICHERQCISACNPACGLSESCNAQGECVSQSAVAPKFADIPPEVPAEGAERHDGFFLRFTVGFGFGGANLEAAGDETDFGAVAGFFSFDIGAAAVENLIVHARLAATSLVNPEVEVNGRDRGSDDSLTIGTSLLGVGVTYYFMPINLYVGATAGLAWVNFTYSIDIDGDGDDDTYSSDAGFGLNLDVGKEWWVGDDWGWRRATRHLRDGRSRRRLGLARFVAHHGHHGRAVLRDLSVMPACDSRVAARA